MLFAILPGALVIAFDDHVHTLDDIALGSGSGNVLPTTGSCKENTRRVAAERVIKMLWALKHEIPPEMAQADQGRHG